MDLELAKEKYLTGDFKLKGEFRSSRGRQTVLSRCEVYAGWTLPTLFPYDGDETEEMQNDYQSVGAQAVTNLANKIMMALFQPSRPFYKMELSSEQQSELEENGLPQAAIDKALAAAERQGMKDLDKMNARVVMTEIIQQLIVCGNALLYIPPKEGALQGYSLRDYAIRRNLRGEMVRLIIRETNGVLALSDELQALALLKGYREDDEVSLYTGVQRVTNDKFLVWQELEDLCYCHDRVGWVNEDELNWIPLAWNIARNKDYGTGLVENYSGDFHSLSTLAESKLDYTTIITDVKFLVNPTGMTDVRKISNSASGAYVHGREEDISTLAADIAQAGDYLTASFADVERRIGVAFLMNSAVTRDAERVTAEEIRMQATELEQSLGGVYSRLAKELQLPLASRLMKKQGEIFKDIEPVIVTGLESLSRSSELDRIRNYFSDLIPLSELPPQVGEQVDPAKLMAVLGAGHGVDYDKMMRTPEEVQAYRKQIAEQNAAAAGAEAGAVSQAQEQPQ
tara:strand:- start:9369 stop:10901 length:1533 start_codon:yes stop_codon:yes gene_type:complete